LSFFFSDSLCSAALLQRLREEDASNIAFALECFRARDYIHVNSFSYDFWLYTTAKLLCGTSLPSQSFNFAAIFTHCLSMWRRPPAFSRNFVDRIRLPLEELQSKIESSNIVTLIDSLPEASFSVRVKRHVFIQRNGQRIVAFHHTFNKEIEVIILLMPDLDEDYLPETSSEDRFIYVLLVDRAERFPLKTLQPQQDCRRPLVQRVQKKSIFQSTALPWKCTSSRETISSLAVDLFAQALQVHAKHVREQQLWTLLRAETEAWECMLKPVLFYEMLGLIKRRDFVSIDPGLLPLLQGTEKQWAMVLDKMLSKNKLARVIALDLSDPRRAIQHSSPRFMHMILLHPSCKHVAAHAWYDQGIRSEVLERQDVGGALYAECQCASVDLMRYLVHHLTCFLWRSITL
jgi:hypothetical protein